MPLSRLLALGLLAPLLVVASPASAQPDPCDKYGCPEPIVIVSPETVCVGVGGDWGGSAYCWYAERPHCYTQYFWNSYHERCLPVDDLGPVTYEDPCNAIDCPRPVYHVSEERVCVGVAFNLGGGGACWFAERPNCVTTYAGFSYAERCVPPTDVLA